MRSLLNAWNHTITVIGTANCTVGHMPYAFTVYCKTKLILQFRVQNTDIRKVFV